MKAVRKTLRRLGWPVEHMSDHQITRELYRRWFAVQPVEPDPEEPVSVASARGILIVLASEGNLDALCWADDDVIPDVDVLSDEEQALFFHEADAGPAPFPDRRRLPRRPARELVRWRATYGEPTQASGWLVDRSPAGIAFIALTSDAPETGAQIAPRIFSRRQGVIDLGQAVVVRTEPLNSELTLVCVRLEHEAWNPAWQD